MASQLVTLNNNASSINVQLSGIQTTLTNLDGLIAVQNTNITVLANQLVSVQGSLQSLVSLSQNITTLQSFVRVCVTTNTHLSSNSHPSLWQTNSTR